MKTIDKARLCLQVVQERKATAPVLLEVYKLSSMTDYFLVASGNSSRQVQAIVRHVFRRLKEKGFKLHGIEGEHEGHWVLMDYGDVVIHIFYQPFREFYDIEGLWIEAPRIQPAAEDNMSAAQ
jgi:ribosome-associated protein